MKAERLLVLISMAGVLASCVRERPTEPLTVSAGTMSTLSGTHYYVSPTGLASNPGTQAAPWSLTRSLTLTGYSTPVGGDTVYLMNGVYSGDFRGFRSGTPGNPITYRQLSSAFLAATIDGTIRMDGADIVLRGFEIKRSDPTGTLPGVEARGARQKYINLIVHDAAQQGITFWDEAIDSEVYGCIVYNNGFHTNQDHGIYVHNSTGTKVIEQNVFFNNKSYGIHVYAQVGDPPQKNVQILHNASFNNGTISYDFAAKSNILVGDKGIGGATGMVVYYNNLYFSGTEGINLEMGYEEPGYQSTGHDMTVQANHMTGGRIGMRILEWDLGHVEENYVALASQYLVDLKDASPSGYFWAANEWNADSTSLLWWPEQQGSKLPMSWTNWKAATGLNCESECDMAFGALFRGQWNDYNTNKYEHGRGMIGVLNLTGQATDQIWLGSFVSPGETYKIYNVLNLNTPVATGTFNNAYITLSMAAVIPPTPVNTQVHVGATPGPYFHVFIVTN